ncbi:putative alpha mannosyltransferase [Phytophthora cinnamomi]|nr:putative alpha mannosyltransferase [Phytophthora cinnamomi]
MLQLKIEFQDLPETSYVARAFISDSVERYHETGPVSFSLLSGHDFDAYVVSQREQIRVGHGFPRDLNALQWAQQQQSETSNIGSGGSINHTADPHSDEVQLLIGVKTAVLRNFAQRQAIRDTWAKKTDLPPNVRVFFLGCTPVILDHLNRQRNLDAVNLERAVYQDLLTDELQCDDKYTLLTEKVSAFFQWLVAEFPRTKAVMITDDDVYVRVDQLVADLSKIEQRKGLYIGELSDTLHPDPLAPREYMFDILNAMEAVDALGVCAGSSRLPDVSYRTSRFSNWYNDDAVTTFQRYKFVIAFENSGVPGYATEKLVNPLLAGSIPIYLGNSTTVSELFNPNSFIDCGRFEKLRDCAQHVMKIHRSPELYEHMRREPPIRNIAAFNEAFSWHPSVLSRDLADKVAKLIQATQR